MIDAITLMPNDVFSPETNLEIPLVVSNVEDAPFIITNIEGLGPVNASINITPYASGDGGVFNSSRKDSRNIVITMKLGKKPNMETNRRKIYKTCPTGKKIGCMIRFKSPHDFYNLEYVGYTESIACDYFGDQEGIQISIVCPDPGFDY